MQKIIRPFEGKIAKNPIKIDWTVRAADFYMLNWKYPIKCIIRLQSEKKNNSAENIPLNRLTADFYLHRDRMKTARLTTSGDARINHIKTKKQQSKAARGKSIFPMLAEINLRSRYVYSAPTQPPPSYFPCGFVRGKRRIYHRRATADEISSYLRPQEEEEAQRARCCAEPRIDASLIPTLIAARYSCGPSTTINKPDIYCITCIIFPQGASSSRRAFRPHASRARAHALRGGKNGRLERGNRGAS